MLRYSMDGLGRSNDSFWRRLNLKSTNISSVLGGLNFKSEKDHRDDNESEVTLVPQYVNPPPQTLCIKHLNIMLEYFKLSR